MKRQILTTLSVFVLALSTPLLAQSTDQPVTNQPGNDQAVVQDQSETPEVATPEEEVPMEQSTQSEEIAEPEEEQELPKTASPLALLALLGAGAGTSAFGLRRRRRS